jgi:hypothetical protein
VTGIFGGQSSAEQNAPLSISTTEENAHLKQVVGVYVYLTEDGFHGGHGVARRHCV